VETRFRALLGPKRPTLAKTLLIGGRKTATGRRGASLKKKRKEEGRERHQDGKKKRTLPKKAKNESWTGKSRDGSVVETTRVQKSTSEREKSATTNNGENPSLKIVLEREVEATHYLGRWKGVLREGNLNKGGRQPFLPIRRKRKCLKKRVGGQRPPPKKKKKGRVGCYTRQPCG